MSPFDGRHPASCLAGSIVMTSPTIALTREARVARRPGLTRAQDLRRDEATTVR
jgi:hypothetical protein